METPTILIPGIKGTTLVNSNTLNFDTIFSGIQSKFETIYDLELEENPEFESTPKAIIERGDIEDLAYREAVFIINEKTKSPFYIFGYDWRKSNVENGKKLKKYVDYLKDKLNTNEFNFLTHSMGGMVFSCFLNELKKSDELKKDNSPIKHAVLTVCPFEGSVQALIALTMGEGGIKFPFFNSNDEFRKISRTFPSVYELCPTYEGAITFDSTHDLAGSSFDICNPNHWQKNIPKKSNHLFQSRLNNLKEFRDQTNPAIFPLNKLPDHMKAKILIMVGQGEETKEKVVVNTKGPNGKVENFFNFDFKGASGDGDGTVSLRSSAVYKDDNMLTLAVKSKWYDKATHSFFLNDGRVQTVINRFFNDRTSFPEWWSDLGNSVTTEININ